MRTRSLTTGIITVLMVALSGCTDRPDEHQKLWMTRSAPMALEATNSIVQHLSFKGCTTRVSEIVAGNQHWYFVASYPPRGIARVDIYCFAYDNNEWYLRAVIYAESIYAAPLRYEADHENGNVNIYSKDTLLGSVSNQKAHEAKEFTLEKTNSVKENTNDNQ